MDGNRLVEILIGALLVSLLFFGIAALGARAYTDGWKRDCDKLGAVVVDGIAYKCERLNTRAATGEESK